RAPEPDDGLGTQVFELRARVGPRDVGVLGSHGFRKVVCEQRGMLVTALAHPFDPRAELGVQPGSSRLRETSVGNLARERVLEHILDFAFEGRTGPATDEVAALEEMEVWLVHFEELVDGAGPEDAADDRS